MAVTIPADTVRVNINWTLPGNEIAVNSLHFRHEHVSENTLDWAGDMTQRYANLVRDGLSSAWSSLGVLWNSQIKVRDCTAYHLGTDGKTIDKATSLPAAGDLIGLATGTMLPLEVALVVSLYGYAPGVYDPQGGRKRGRIYLPAPATTRVDTTGRVQTISSVLGFIQPFVTYVNNRKMDARPTFNERAHLAILSTRFGELNDVKQIRVDDLLDVQKRRQNNLTPIVAAAAAGAQT